MHRVASFRTWQQPSLIHKKRQMLEAHIDATLRPSGFGALETGQNAILQSEEGGPFRVTGPSNLGCQSGSPPLSLATTDSGQNCGCVGSPLENLRWSDQKWHDVSSLLSRLRWMILDDRILTQSQSLVWQKYAALFVRLRPHRRRTCPSAGNDMADSAVRRFTMERSFPTTPHRNCGIWAACREQKGPERTRHLLEIHHPGCP